MNPLIQKLSMEHLHHGCTMDMKMLFFPLFPPLLKLLQKEIRYEPSTKFSEMAPMTYVT